MFFKLFLIFAVVPVAELAILIKIGTLMGTLNTVLLVVGTAVLGAYLVRMEGLNVFYRFHRNLSEGVFPAEEIFDGALLLVAGAVLITPGLLTDILGLLLVFPPSRKIFKKIIRRYVEETVTIV
jgi:UPF0716 protein FxsA